MLKKVIFSTSMVVLIVAVGILIAQEGNNTSGEQQLQRPPREFGRPRRGYRSTELSAFDKAPIPKTEEEKKILAVLNDMRMNQNRGLIIAHNITPQQADPKYVEAITTNPDLESVLFGGVSITLKKR